jgi:hypothetical protein
LLRTRIPEPSIVVDIEFIEGRHRTEYGADIRPHGGPKLPVESYYNSLEIKTLPELEITDDRELLY